MKIVLEYCKICVETGALKIPFKNAISGPGTGYKGMALNIKSRARTWGLRDYVHWEGYCHRQVIY